MPYQLNPNDIVQVVVRYAQFNVVEMMNVLHYRYVGTEAIADGGAAIANMTAYFASALGTAGWSSRWAATASNFTNIDRYSGQRVYPVRMGVIDLDVAVPGTVDAQPLPGLVQWAITKRGDLATRYSVGGIRVPGMAESNELGGEISDPFFPTCQNLAALMSLTMTPVAGQVWEPVVYRRTNPGSSVRVVQAFAQKVLRSQRTRISFRGI